MMPTLLQSRGIRLMFATILMLLWLPMLQQFFGLVEEPPLRGAFVRDTLPELSSLHLSNWLNGSFQSKLNNALESHIGFRNTLVRLHNQWQWMLFGKANAEGVLAGHHGELFEEDYLKAASGLFFVGHAHWARKAAMLKQLQDTLRMQGKLLLVLLEPGKGSTLMSFAPKHYRSNLHTSNYAAMCRAFDSLGVEYIDLQKCFTLWNDTSSYLLFPRTGTHWSYYGAWLAADTLSRYLASHWPGSIHPPLLDVLQTNLPIRHPDDDIWLAMNVLAKPPLQALAYPRFRFTPSESGKPSILVVGDSFYFNWQNDGIMDGLSEGGEFWYYNKIRWNHKGSELGVLNADERIPLALQHDIVLIMITERFHQNFAWKFDEQLYEHFFPGQTQHRQGFFADIVAANEVFLRLYADAAKRGIPLVERLWMEADYLMYLAYQAHPERFVAREDRIALTMMAIRNTPHWLAEVEKKARDRKLPLETMIRLDAEWIVDNTPASP